MRIGARPDRKLLRMSQISGSTDLYFLVVDLESAALEEAVPFCCCCAAIRASAAAPAGEIRGPPPPPPPPAAAAPAPPAPPDPAPDPVLAGGGAAAAPPPAALELDGDPPLPDAFDTGGGLERVCGADTERAITACAIGRALPPPPPLPAAPPALELATSEGIEIDAGTPPLPPPFAVPLPLPLPLPAVEAERVSAACALSCWFRAIDAARRCAAAASVC